MSDTSPGNAGTDWRDLTAIVLLSITAILTAWCGFQSSKWGGAMSIAFSQASSARIEATRLDGVANRKMSIHVALFTQWLDAEQEGATELTDFLAARFPDPLAPAFQAWQDTDPTHNAEAPETPFVMPEYAIPELAQSQRADERAEAKFQEALTNNQRGDNYTVLTVLYATVLFFAALSDRMKSARGQTVVLAVGLLGFAVATTIMLSFPRLV